MPREIQLTKNNVAIVDDGAFEKLSIYSWRYQNGYAARTTSRTSGKRTTILMHREIFGEVIDGYDIDHINGNKLDNRADNLRVATREQNAANGPKRSRNTSGYKGVSFDTRRNKWRSRLRTRGIYVWIGYFSCKHEAARAYNAKAHELFGEYARLNEIPGEDSA